MLREIRTLNKQLPVFAAATVQNVTDALALTHDFLRQIKVNRLVTLFIQLPLTVLMVDAVELKSTPDVTS